MRIEPLPLLISAEIDNAFLAEMKNSLLQGENIGGRSGRSMSRIPFPV